MPLFADLEAPMTAEVYDALIVGGGPAGSTTALLLARAGWSVALVERAAFPRRKVCGEYLSASNMPLLDRLGVGGLFREQAGPPIRRVGLFAGKTMIEADLPTPRGTAWGRALSRERLDSLLIEGARQSGADVRQPCKISRVARAGNLFECGLESSANRATDVLKARIVVAAHGSWDAGSLPTQPPRQAPKASDWLGFKSHFYDSSLPPDLMPLVAFPGGYGGMVRSETGRVSLSCCLRRDKVTALRQMSSGDAGPAILRHIEENCAGVKQTLAGARRDGPWLAAGPLRPGVRTARHPGIFLVGNAAGEAHPVIAEGISIALQSAWLLCRRLIAWKVRETPALASVARAYADDWRRHFRLRICLSQVIAEWAMRPAAVACSVPLFRFCPPVLTAFARLSGKVHEAVGDLL